MSKIRKLVKAKKCRLKECALRFEQLEAIRLDRNRVLAHLDAANNEIKRLKETNHEDLDHLRARTELMKAISWLSKTASSALWSDRKNAWARDKS